MSPREWSLGQLRQDILVCLREQGPLGKKNLCEQLRRDEKYSSMGLDDFRFFLDLVLGIMCSKQLIECGDSSSYTACAHEAPSAAEED